MSAAPKSQAGESQARPWLTVIGMGEDGLDGISAAARTLIGGAALVVGGARHLRLADGAIRGERMAWPHPMTDGYAAVLAWAGRDVVVLASGDPFCFGVGSALAALVGPGEMMCVPAVSAFALAAGRLGWAQQDVATVSFCGRPMEALFPLLHHGARVLALSADAGTPAVVAGLLVERGFGASVLYVLEALGGVGERIRASTAAAAGVPGDIGALNMMAIEVVAGVGARVVPLSAGLPDEMFEHDGQLTKQEVRAVTLAALAPCAGQVLWDVGAGSGSVSIEWCLLGSRKGGRGTRALAIEARADRAARAARNALGLGAVGVEVVVGQAPAVLTGLAAPDAVFVGGGLQVAGLLEAVWTALRPGGRLVANAVALDTQGLLFDAQARLGGTLTRLAVERLDQIGTMRAFRPAMAIVQWVVLKK